tara:strand:- start:12975 stop:13655 length:681 start_codon:yes stop_codon:yes gene_type:complete
MNIIQTWKDNKLPPYLVTYQNNIMKFKGNWNYLFFDDDSITSFFKNNMPQYYEFFKQLTYKIQQIDFFRYCAVYYYGGLYLDLDFFLTNSPDILLNYDCAFPIEQKNIDDIIILNNNYNNLIGNYAFYAKKNNPFIKSIIDNIVKPKITLYDIQEGCKSNGDSSDQVFVYYTTGPILVSYTYATYELKREVTLLTTDPFYPNLFGKLGSHRMFGTWKLKNSTNILK